ncbi:MAG: nitronate monooxygenase [Dehalococcoidales bacterium]|nr:nitronate monooxygenase [Dehalococcoidales bacterium]
MKKNRISELLSIEHPVLQAPMSWITDAVLAAAVSNAGGLGIIGPNGGAQSVTSDVIETGERLRSEIRKAKSLTDKPFGVNVLAYEGERFEFTDQCVKVILEEGIAVAALCGDYPEKYAKQFKDAGIKQIFRALPSNNVDIARRAEQAGMDAFIAAGLEGGGHIGLDRITTFVLIPQVVDAIKIPVIAGGGIVDGKGMVAAMALGAEGVYLGTRFIATNECPAHPTYKQAIIDAIDTSTVTFTSMVGLCRALKTPPVERLVQMEEDGTATYEEMVKVHRHETRPWLEGDWSTTVFPSGACAAMIHKITSAAEVVNGIVNEADEIMKKMCSQD